MTDQARCLIVTNNFPPVRGGSVTVYHNLCKHGGGEVMALAPRADYLTGSPLADWREHDQDAPYKVYRLHLLRAPPATSLSWPQAPRLAMLAELLCRVRLFFTILYLKFRENINVLCIGELVTGGWLAQVCKYIARMKVIIYVHGEELTIDYKNWSMPKHRSKYLSLADAVVTVGEFGRRGLIEQMGISDDKISVINNGVDTEKFFPKEKNSSLVQKYGLLHKKVLLGVGRLVERKGFDRVLGALPFILRRQPDAHYVILGDGPERAVLERIARDRGVEDHVTFVGAVSESDLNDHYALCDLFILANRETADGDTEGFGLVFLEANACGKPVIAGSAGGVRDAVDDGVNGLCVDGTDPSSIADAVIRLLEDRALYERLRKGGLERAGRLDWRSRAKMFTDLCRRLVVESR